MFKKIMAFILAVLVTWIVLAGLFNLYKQQRNRADIIGTCSSCGYVVIDRVFWHISGLPKVPRLGCPNDLTILEWTFNSNDNDPK